MSLSCFRLEWIGFRVPFDGGGEVNLGEGGHRGVDSVDFELRPSVILSMPEACGGGLLADSAL
jgi:hypothetical protein